jgi:hypothetical protein
LARDELQSRPPQVEAANSRRKKTGFATKFRGDPRMLKAFLLRAVPAALALGLLAACNDDDNPPLPS